MLELSANTQAILLLTAPLIVGRAKSPADPLSAGEYRRLARRLRELRREPADLLESEHRKVSVRFLVDPGTVPRTVPQVNRNRWHRTVEKQCRLRRTRSKRRRRRLAYQKPDSTPADALLATVMELVGRMDMPATEAEVAERLQVTRKQAGVWLNRLVEMGVMEKLSRPARFRFLVSNVPLLDSRP